MRTYHRVVASALLTGQIAAVSAQDQTETAAFGLEEVVVTAQKREQSLQDVPIAISALSAAALEQAGVQDMYDVAAQVPSLSVQQNTNPMNAQFRLRGVGNLGNIPNFEPAVAYFIDGAFRARSGLALGDLNDLDRVEILKGPQSTLYGKNSTAASWLSTRASRATLSSSTASCARARSRPPAMQRRGKRRPRCPDRCPRPFAPD